MAGKFSARALRKDYRVRLSVHQLEDRLVPAPIALINEGFDNVTLPNLPAGWTTQTLAGTANNWVTAVAPVGAFFIQPSPSAPNVAFADDQDTFSDSVLVSPTVTIPGTSGDPFNRPLTATLTFQNAFFIEQDFDGYRLEISINGGAFQDIQAAGGVFITGGYNGVVTTTPTPPASSLAGQPAWTGGNFTLTTDFVFTQLDLTNAVNPGDTVQFRWRVSSDNSVDQEGIEIDDVLFTVNSPFTPSPNEKFTVSSGPGAQKAQVFVYDALRQMYGTLTPFPGFRGELHTATGDVTGDGVEDVVVSPGAGFAPFVLVYDGATGVPVRGLLALPPNYNGGVNVAVGDVNGDGFADIITAPAGKNGMCLVNVFDGRNSAPIRSFFAYPPIPSIQGVSVAAGDINGDGQADIITAPGAGAPSVVVAWDGASGNALQAFLAYAPNYTFGANLAAGDINGDGRAEIFTAPALGSSLVNIYDPTVGRIVRSFFAYEPLQSTGGTRIATSDVDRDGLVEILTSTGPLPGVSSPEVRRFNANIFLFDGFYPFEGVFQNGGFVG